MKLWLPLLFAVSTLFALNRMEYNDIMLGTPIAQVLRIHGEPYAVYDLNNGTRKYEYVERVSMNRELIYENHYFLTVTDGKVVSKCFSEESRPAYDQLFQVDPNYPTYP